MRVRPDLDAERAEASRTKIPLHMDRDSRLELMYVLLEIQKIAGEAFDIIEAQTISPADVLLILQIPDWCNKFTKGMEAHARKMASINDQLRNTRQRSSYMSTKND